MEPFRIICETCRSRLKIRSPEVIGEIHACPKCGSMVHILPPAGWRPDSVPATVAVPGVPGEAALSLSTTASVIIPASMVGDLRGAISAPELQVAEVPAPIQPVAPAISPIVLWAVGASAAVLVGGVALAIWPSRDDKVPAPQPVVSMPGAVAQQPKAVPRPMPAVSDPYAVDHSPESTKQTIGTNTPAVIPAAPNPLASSNPPPASQPPAVTKAENTAAPPKPATGTNAVASNATAAPAKLVEPAAKAGEHPPVLKFDPLDFDPDRLGATAKTSNPSTTSTSSVPDRPPADAVHVANNGVAAAVNLPRSDKGQPAGVAAPAAAANSSITVRRAPSAADGPAAKKAGQPLAARLKSIQLGQMPLARLIEALSDIAGSGITLDPVALELVGISPRTLVSVNAQDASLEKILRDALSPQRLDFVAQGEQIRVALPKPDERRAVDYDVKDLVTGTDAAGIAQMIEKFVAPPTWKSSGGAGTIQVNGTTLQIEQSDAVRRQVVIFCERLRLARGLALRSKYPAALLSIEPPYQTLASKLNEHTTFTFLAWTRLADVIHQWQEMSGLTILVDWASLAEAELSPSSPIACSAIDRPWREALDGVLEPLGLAWWAVDGQTVQITSLNALERIQRVEFYQVPQKLRASFASGQALIDSLQKGIGETGKSGKPVRMEIDEPSSRLIVLATPNVHRQLSRRLSGKP